MAPTTTDFVPPPEITASAAWARLEDQQQYFSSRATRAQRLYRSIKLALILTSAAIPILVFVPMPGETAKFLVAAAGVAIAVLEGVLLLGRYGENGVIYRRTAESLKRERALLLAGAGDYRGLAAADALRLLAERTEALLSEENRQWVEAQLKTLQTLSNTKDFVRAQAPPAPAGG